MYYDPSGNVLLIAVVSIAMVRSGNKYNKNKQSHGITEENIDELLDKSELGITITDNSCSVDNSYNYTEEEMWIICEKFKKKASSLDVNSAYNEWLAHNYAYYFFTETNIGMTANYIFSSLFKYDCVEASKKVDLGTKPETGPRKLFFDVILFFGNL